MINDDLNCEMGRDNIEKFKNFMRLINFKRSKEDRNNFETTTTVSKIDSKLKLG